MKPNKGLLIALLVVVAIGAGYFIWQKKSASDDEAALKVPPVRPNAPDFGGLPPENVIGATPGGPTGPGARAPK
jgi:hypothetical protein